MRGSPSGAVVEDQEVEILFKNTRKVVLLTGGITRFNDIDRGRETFGFCQRESGGKPASLMRGACARGTGIRRIWLVAVFFFWARSRLCARGRRSPKVHIFMLWPARDFIKRFFKARG